MKLLLGSLSLVVAGMLLAPAVADEGDGGDRKARFIKEFDKDNDGKLSDEEKAAAREAFSKRRAERGEKGAPQGRQGKGRPSREEILKKYDENKNGQLDPEEREKAFAAMRARRGEGRGGPQFDRKALMEKFDKDGDGKLSEAEREEVKKHFQELRAKRGEGAQRPGFDRAKIVEEFDKDKDGKLSEEERSAAREALRERFRKGREGREGRGPRGKERPAPDKE